MENSGIVSGIVNVVNIAGLICTSVCIVATIGTVIVWSRFIIPVLRRFGMVIWKRQIAIVSNDPSLVTSIEIDLTSTHMLRKKNLCGIPINNLKDLPKYSVVIIDCGSFSEEAKLAKVIDDMDASIGVVLYCRPGCKRLSDELMMKVNNSSRVILTNFRGRLVNDIVASLVSTPYEEK